VEIVLADVKSLSIRTVIQKLHHAHSEVTGSYTKAGAVAYSLFAVATRLPTSILKRVAASPCCPFISEIRYECDQEGEIILNVITRYQSTVNCIVDLLHDAFALKRHA
jgi:hypothetical protein